MRNQLKRVRMVLFVAAAMYLSAAAVRSASAQRKAPESPPAAEAELCNLVIMGMPTKGTPDIRQVEKVIRSLQQRHPTDGRVDLCVALIRLSSQRSVVKGLDALERAHKKNVLPAAHRLQVQQYLSLHKHDEAAAALLRFARTLRSKQADNLTDEEMEKSARWIGRVVGFFQHPGAQIADGKPVQAIASGIQLTLDQELQVAYKAGVASIVAEWEERKKPGRLEEDVLSDEARLKREEVLEKAFAGKDQVAIGRDDLNLKGQELEAWHTKSRAAIESELNPRLQIFEKLILQYKYWDGKRRSIDIGGDGISEDQEIENCAILERQLANLDQEIKGLMSVYWQIESMYWKAKGQVNNRAAQLSDAERQLNLMKANATGDFFKARATRLPAKVDALETYVPFDLRAERDGLLAQWGYTK